MKDRKLILRVGLIAAIIFGVGFFATFTDLVSLPSVSITVKEGESPGPINNRSLESGTEIRLIYIGSSTCPASTSEEMPRLFERIVARVQEGAAERGLKFTSVGIAVEWKVASGLQHLRRVGEFDEVGAGQNWYNQYAYRYFWGDAAGRVSTPQVVVESRVLDVPETEGEQFSVRDTQLLARAAGLRAIRRLAQGSLGIRWGQVKSEGGV